MSNRLLIRPSVQKKHSKVNSGFLPADLAAAYASYHENMAEQKKLELKLWGIDMETKQMKRDIRQRKEVLERELKEREDDFWGCHRVFSAATLITESDSFRKCFYTGPQPTKAKLPRGKLDRLSHLVRKLQAEDDLETLLRFQRCARYATRREDRPKSALSLTFDEESDITEADSTSQCLTEVINAPRMGSIGSISGDTSGRVKRIRSAPLRIASEKEELRPRNRSRGRSVFPQHPLKKAHGETFCYSKEGSPEIVLHSYDRQRSPIKMAWTEDAPRAENKVIGSNEIQANSGVDSSNKDSLDLTEEKTQWRRESRVNQSPEIERLASFSPEQQSHETSVTDLSNLSRSQHLLPESSSEHLQSVGNTTSTGQEKTIDSELLSEDGLKANGTMGGEVRQSIAEDRYQQKDLVHRSKHDDVRVSSIKEIEPSESDLPSALQNEEATNVSDEDQRLNKRDTLQLESSEQYTFRIRAEPRYSETSETEKFDAHTRGEKIARDDFHVTVERRGTHNIKKAKAQHRQGGTTLPKSSLHGLSSRRKSLVPRNHHKNSQQHTSGFSTVKNTRGGKPELGVAPGTESPSHKVAHSEEEKMRQGERQSSETKKRKISIFKRKCLSDLLFVEQVKLESRLRNRVQGFLSDKTS
ncbi:unnamed protein product [Porites evermanni]|uniref:Uncharacterized protein n=1 Tax=Porites evermanni TaxID=104178 RepID=A0ABN8RKL0_9CNID|nr:unnamed protein product [Porites evermanni]